MHLYPWLPAHHTRVHRSLSCAQLDLRYNELGPEGAAALAPASAVCASPLGTSMVRDLVYLFSTASLTRLDVSYNKLDRGGNGVQLLRDAVRQREGFVLIDDGNI